MRFQALALHWKRLACDCVTALLLELLSSGRVRADEDPWPFVEAILLGKENPPQAGIRSRSQGRSTKVAGSFPRAARVAEAPLAVCYDSESGSSVVRAHRAGKGYASLQSLIEKFSTIRIETAEVDLGDWSDSPVSIGMIVIEDSCRTAP